MIWTISELPAFWIGCSGPPTAGITHFGIGQRRRSWLRFHGCSNPFRGQEAEIFVATAYVGTREATCTSPLIAWMWVHLDALKGSLVLFILEETWGGLVLIKIIK